MNDSTPPERRPAGRSAAQLRPLSIELGIQRNALGSCLISTGQTRVICAASVEARVPPWMKGQDRGWVTAEYGMLPGSGSERIARKQSSRATEIQRLIGRSLRAVVDLPALNGFTVTVDCDVLDADGGTRTASITGAWVALHEAFRKLLEAGMLTRSPMIGQVAAVSAGIVAGLAVLDLDYKEDEGAEVDLNVVGTGAGELVEVQGTAEKKPFTRKQLDAMVDLAQAGIGELMVGQRRVLGLGVAG